ncbi:MAG: hypothetical protein JW891_13075 [Candidatus Lokiarchaeota archaeon]|nr:hypothetical protein [Candidatus Lokiarchaeota archaeon]
MKKRYSTLLTLILVITNVSIIVQPITAATIPIGAEYDWGEETVLINQSFIWNNTVFSSHEKGWDNRTESFMAVYEDKWGVENPNTYFEYSRSGYYADYVEIYRKNTVTGNMTNTINMNVYKVEASYDDSLQFTWMAVKDCYWTNDIWLVDNQFNYNYTHKDYRNETIIWTERYHENDSIASLEIETNEGWYPDHFTEGTQPPSDFYYHQVMQQNFTMPLILTTQVYKTQNGEHVAWMDMFYSYIVYNDTDGNGIYSADLSDTSGSIGAVSIGSSNECRGVIYPMAISVSSTLWSYYKNNNSLESPPESGSFSFPNDLTLDALSNNIVFTPPLDENNVLKWDIEYPDYPIYGYVKNASKYDDDVYVAGKYNYATYQWDYLNYSQASPGDFGFGFNYEIGRSSSNLDYTIDLPQITNQSFYDGVKGCGLSIPHYTYLIASSEIEESVISLVSKSADIFNFEIGGINFAEMDMMNPAKQNYTLYDYPSLGKISEFSSQGGTVAKIITSSLKQNFWPQFGGDLFSSIIFSLEDLVSDNPFFNNPQNLYSIETQNYPIWSGNRIVHDPTLRAYYTTSSVENPPILIVFVFGSIIIGSTISVVMPIAYALHRKTKKSYIKTPIGNIQPKIKDKDNYMEKIKLLELNAEEESLLIRDLLFLSPSERQDILNNMLKLKNSRKNDLFL